MGGVGITVANLSTFICKPQHVHYAGGLPPHALMNASDCVFIIYWWKVLQKKKKATCLKWVRQFSKNKTSILQHLWVTISLCHRLVPLSCVFHYKENYSRRDCGLLVENKLCMQKIELPSPLTLIRMHGKSCLKPWESFSQSVEMTLS